jgi:hypothetical protein
VNQNKDKTLDYSPLRISCLENGCVPNKQGSKEHRRREGENIKSPTWLEMEQKGAKLKFSRAEWLMHVIPATLASEIRKMQAQAKFSETYLKNKKLIMVVFICHFSCVGSISRKITVQAAWTRTGDPISKITKTKEEDS